MKFRKFFLIVFLIIFSTNIYAEEKKAPDNKIGKVYFTETSYSFPALVEGVELVHDFVIKNTGDGVLKIEKVKTG